MASEMRDKSILQTPLYLDEVTKCSQWAARDAAERVLRTMPYRIGRMNLESPLEAAFAMWWFTITDAAKPGLLLESQVEIVVEGELFRADFVIREDPSRPAVAKTPAASFPILAIVELDGHQFHEKTREQVARRNHRDRALQGAGYRVVHFSFSEVTSDGQGCVIDATRAAWGKWLELAEKEGR